MCARGADPVPRRGLSAGASESRVLSWDSTRRAPEPPPDSSAKHARLLTPARIALAAALTVGVVAGLGGDTFVYARGASYMTNDPAACANCHVMEEHFAAWMKSSHRAVAVCNDCHAPHDMIGKYIVKAENGWRHSVAFTTGRHPDPMRITPRNARVTEQACRDCHAGIVAAMSGQGMEGVPRTSVVQAAHGEPPGSQAVSCIHCHRNVGHWVR